MINENKIKYNFRILLPITIYWSEFLPERDRDWVNFQIQLDKETFEISIGMGNRYYTMVEKNGRMAVIESCTALEASTKQTIPILLENISSKLLSISDIDKAINKIGFSKTM